MTLISEASNDSPGDDNTGGSAVVADRQVFPVWHESVLLPPEHGAHVGGVVQGRVEVCVVPDVGREVHRDPGLGHQRLRPQPCVIPALGVNIHPK